MLLNTQHRGPGNSSPAPEGVHLQRKFIVSPTGFNKHFLTLKKKNPAILNRATPNNVLRNHFASFYPPFNADVYPTSLLLLLKGTCALVTKQGGPVGQTPTLLRGSLLGNLLLDPVPIHAPALLRAPLTPAYHREKPISTSQTTIPLRCTQPPQS